MSATRTAPVHPLHGAMMSAKESLEYELRHGTNVTRAKRYYREAVAAWEAAGKP